MLKDLICQGTELVESIKVPNFVCSRQQLVNTRAPESSRSDGLTFSLSLSPPFNKRSKSAPVAHTKGSGSDTDNASEEVNGHDENSLDDPVDEADGLPGDDDSREPARQNGSRPGHHGSSDELINEHFYDMPEGEDYMAIYETIDRKRQEAKELKNRSASMEELETPTHSIKSFNMNNGGGGGGGGRAEPQMPKDPAKRRHRSKSGSKSSENRKSAPDPPLDPVGDGMAQFLKKALRIEGPQLTQRTLTIRKNARESLGMRIGGGIGSNEGDTPIYVANIHPHGCIGKSKQLKVAVIFSIYFYTDLYFYSSFLWWPWKNSLAML